MSGLCGRRRIEWQFGIVCVENISTIENLETGSIHAKSSTPIICHAENNGQRRDILFAPDSVHFHI